MSWPPADPSHLTPDHDHPNPETHKLLEGRTGEYAEATADAFLDDWLKTDADRARDAAAASAAATAAVSAGPPDAMGLSSPRVPQLGSSAGARPTDEVAGGHGGAGRRSSATHNKGGSHTTPKKTRSSQDHGHGNGHDHHGSGHHHHDRSHGGGGGGGRHAHDSGKGRAPYDPARAESTSSSDSEGGRLSEHVAANGRPSHAKHGGDGGHGNKNSPQRRRNAAVGPTSPSIGVSPNLHTDSQESAGERHQRRNRAGINQSPLEVPSRDKSNRISSATEHRRGRSTEAGEGNGSPKAGPQPQTDSRSPNQPEDDAERESLRRANDDAAQLRATVERLKSELNSIKTGTGVGVGGMVGVGNEGLGSNGINSGTQFGAAAAPMAGPPWVAGWMRQYPVRRHWLFSVNGCFFVLLPLDIRLDSLTRLTDCRPPATRQPYIRLRDAWVA